MAEVQIQKIRSETMRVPLVGMSPLLVHQFSAKARRIMLDTQQGKKTPRQIRDPQAEFEASLYRTAGGYGFPAAGFKKATVGAARFYGSTVTMTALNQMMYTTGVPAADGSQLLTPIEGEPKLREDVVTVGRGAADLRYRAEFRDWSALLTVIYVTTALDRDSVLSLIEAGGLGCGVGEWRPQRGGNFGTYRIDDSRELEIIS